MSKYKKIICLTILISMFMVPTSAFASSSKASSDNKQGILSSILSFFTSPKSPSSPPSNSNNNNNNNKPVKTGWFDWFLGFDSKNWMHDKAWDALCLESKDIWKNYYCY
ncbi:hypothetical protein FHS15_001632 [Paenibacillus castaneae]|uniref:hypothetical protein n=1 Tax=Paenibacillus castaneae TaxID=474957 RepID=UPI000C9BD5DD|nr:hypothetical protein [Paenibacillus castaneae]NIK76507.1 hypothetical protein [Paenibacillus castaneae]